MLHGFLPEVFRVDAETALVARAAMAPAGAAGSGETRWLHRVADKRGRVKDGADPRPWGPLGPRGSIAWLIETPESDLRRRLRRLAASARGILSDGDRRRRLAGHAAEAQR